MIAYLMRVVVYTSNFFYIMLAINAITSWFFVTGRSHPYILKVYQFSNKIIEPIVTPCRNLLRKFNTGPLDFSLILAFILIDIVTKVILMILRSFL